MLILLHHNILYNVQKYPMCRVLLLCIYLKPKYEGTELITLIFCFELGFKSRTK